MQLGYRGGDFFLISSSGRANVHFTSITVIEQMHEDSIPHPSRTNFGLRLVYRVGLGLGLVFIFV